MVCTVLQDSDELFAGSSQCQARRAATDGGWRWIVSRIRSESIGVWCGSLVMEVKMQGGVGSAECFWGRTEFRSFGDLVECNCLYDFDSWIEHEVKWW